MPANVQPATWIASYTSDGANITIPIASLTGLPVPDAEETTGDIRQVTLALLKTLLTSFLAQNPTQMTITPGRSANGVNYVVTFKTTVSAESIPAET